MTFTRYTAFANAYRNGLNPTALEYHIDEAAAAVIAHQIDMERIAANRLSALTTARTTADSKRSAAHSGPGRGN